MSVYADPVHEALSALGGKTNWYERAELLQGLHAHGAGFVTDAFLLSHLTTPTYKNLDEHDNPPGVYRKKYGSKMFLSVGRPGDRPDTSPAVFPPGRQTGDRAFILRGALPDALLKRLKTFVAPKTGGAVPLGDITNPGNPRPRASERNKPVVLPAWARQPLDTHGVAWQMRCGSASVCSFVRYGADGRVPMIVVGAVPSASSAGNVLATPRVLGHELTTTEPLGERSFASSLRQIGDARICPGVGEKDMTPSARPGWAELTQRAAREYSNPLLSGSRRALAACAHHALTMSK